MHWSVQQEVDKYVSTKKVDTYFFLCYIVPRCMEDLWKKRYVSEAFLIFTGTIRNMAPPEILGPMGVDAVYKASYDWCCCKGRLPIRRLARQAVEILYDQAPEYRWEADRE